MKKPETHAPDGDGIDRRGMLKCMPWVGTGLVWTVSGGILGCRPVGAGAPQKSAADFTFAQISERHIGFSKEPNKDVTATMQQAVARLNALETRPDLLLHTGDLTHLSKPDEFDTVAQGGRQAARPAGCDKRQLCRGQGIPGRRGLHAGVSAAKSTATDT